MPHEACIGHLQTALEMIPPGKQNDELRMHVTEALKEVESGYGQEDEMMKDKGKSAISPSASHMSAPEAEKANPYGGSNRRYSYSQYRS
ncbi:MAG: hypothetical protein WC773_04515 [Patescibacteria group bacterium]|jgi:hypothetical protein